ncbi:DUF1206 domain-containing protein [Streptomyces sp. NPDC048002]|uniref:DUF1206 domain-containing protein n=1 Tax=Streptomyces sp. NPDC048002 TaxID=3154344 RepID=UPI0033F27786
MNSSAVARAGRQKARGKTASSVTEGAARAGLAARGVIYVLVGLLALQIAFGDGGEQADRQGAVAEIAGQPFGSALLWALGVGLVGMALWRLSEAAFGSADPDGRKAHKRLLALVRSVFYGFVAFSVLRFAAGGGSGSGSGSGSGDQESRDITATALELPAGQWLVGAGGAVIIGAGAWIAIQAVRREYRDTLRLGEMSRAERRVTDVTGVGGGVARGTVFAALGVFAVQAAVDYEPDKAKGMDDTLRTFADTALGPWLLACVAFGLLLFGIFSFLLARRRRV